MPRSASSRSVVFFLNNPFVHDLRVWREACTLTQQAGYQVTVVCCQDAKNPLPVDEHRPIEGSCDTVRILRLIPKKLDRFAWCNKRTVKAMAQILWHGVLGQLNGKVQVVHAHDANTLLLAWAFCRMKQARWVYDAHEYWPALYQEDESQLETEAAKQAVRKLAAFERWCLCRVDHLISVNTSLCEFYQALATKSGRQALLPVTPVRNIPVDAALLAEKPDLFRQKFDFSPDRRVVLYQGMLTEQRGLGVLAQAFALFRQRQPQHLVALVLMGQIMNAKSQAYIDTLLARPELSGQLFVLPAVSPQVLPQWTASADVGIHPILETSVNHTYCLPNKLFEYIQSELPVIVSNVPEMARIVQEYQVGWTFQAGSAEALYERLLAWAEQPDAAKQAMQQCLKEAKQTLNWACEQHALLRVYQELV